MEIRQLAKNHQESTHAHDNVNRNISY